MTINEKISALRKLMNRDNIDTYIVTKFDPHQSEDAPEYYNGINFISGFNGSSGTVVITKDHAGLWTDSRYHIQAERQLAGSDFVVHRDGTSGVKNFTDFVIDETPFEGTIGFDGATFSIFQTEELINKSSAKKNSFKTDKDLLSEFWENRPAFSKNKIFIHELKYTGKALKEKISEVKSEMEKQNIDTYLISSTDDVAWLLNLRGNDLPNQTTFAGYILIDKENVILFTDLEKASNVSDYLTENNVLLKDYNEVFAYVESLENPNTFGYNPKTTSFAFSKAINSFKNKILNVDIPTELKACKNSVEIENMKETYITDCSKIFKFIKWVKENVTEIDIYEEDIDGKLLEFRNESDEFLYHSFDTIAAYMENAAMMHYSPVKGSSKKIEPKGFLLVDCGGQYYGGTTDITRTIALGNLTDEMKSDFTLTLKSVIALTEAVFISGTAGANLDILARKPMWDNFLDYKAGTGHGIGYCLNVHEDPHSISQRQNLYPIKEGMITSNEPGVYREGKHAVRTENTILTNFLVENEYGRFLCFETISYCPIDINAINVDMLTENELEWLNQYHRDVYEKLSPTLNDEEREFLKACTKSI